MILHAEVSWNIQILKIHLRGVSLAAFAAEGHSLGAVENKA